MAVLSFLTTPFRLAKTIIGKFVSGFAPSIVEGLKSLPETIFSLLKSPFVALWDWLGKTFFGNSPSTLALNIVKGLSSVIGTISDILLAPFRFAQDAIGKVFDALFGRAQQDPTQALMNSISNMSDEKLALMRDVTSLLSSDNLSVNILKTSEAIDNLATSINSLSSQNLLTVSALQQGPTVTETTKEKTTQTVVSAPQTSNDVLISKFDELIGLMKNGSIVVNMDGRKVSRQLVNKVY